MAGAFHYVSPNTYLLGWVVERPMGAARSAYITVDRLGVPRAAGGSCAPARDLALVGQLIVKAGTRGGNQVLPRVWLDDMAAGGHSQAWSAGDFAAYIRASDIVAVVHR
jgi:CubicO group peptidase (beta-lactamase class C family)